MFNGIAVPESWAGARQSVQEIQTEVFHANQRKECRRRGVRNMLSLWNRMETRALCGKVVEAEE